MAAKETLMTPNGWTRWSLPALMALFFFLNGCMPIFWYYMEENKSYPIEPHYPPFNEQEHAKFEGQGTATVTGRVVCHNRNKPAEPMAQRLVILDPMTEYGELFWTCIGVDSAFPLTSSPPDKRFLRYRRQTVTGPHGEFVFSGLPPGRYAVTSTIDGSEDPPKLKKGKVFQKGTKVGDQIEVLADQTVSLELCFGVDCDRASFPFRTDFKRPQKCYGTVKK